MGIISSVCSYITYILYLFCLQTFYRPRITHMASLHHGYNYDYHSIVDVCAVNVCAVNVCTIDVCVVDVCAVDVYAVNVCAVDVCSRRVYNRRVCSRRVYSGPHSHNKPVVSNLHASLKT